MKRDDFRALATIAVGAMLAPSFHSKIQNIHSEIADFEKADRVKDANRYKQLLERTLNHYAQSVCVLVRELSVHLDYHDSDEGSSFKWDENDA